jgi:membrane protein DedA with SNARE-associated domain/membrane-associated phospholipid phosphatase
MSDSISPILQWLNAHPHLAGLATFIISAGESIAIIGTIVPGTVMMTAIGTLAGAGVIPLWSTIIWAILGAIAGDGISYLMGHYFRDRLRFIWPFKNSPNLLERGERFCHKYGGMSVFIGRFVGPVRALVPLIAGMLGMKPTRFLIANVISAIGWAPVYMLPGILLGAASLELPPDVAVHVVLMLLLSGLFIILCLWFAYKILALINNRITQFLNWVWKQLQHSRYFYLITTALKHHDSSKTHGQLALAFYFLVTGLIFLYLAAYISFHPSNTIGIDNAVFHLFRSFRTATGDNIMLIITLFGDKRVLIPVMISVFAWLTWRRCWHTAWHALALIILTAGSIVVFKHLVQSVRPWGIFNGPETFSFPSGHTTLSTTFYLAFGLLLTKSSHLKRKWHVYILLGIAVISISASRLYLGAHWLTDVLGGWLLSATLLMFIALSYNRKTEKEINLREIILLVILTLLTATSVLYTRHFQQLKLNYTQIDWPTYTISEKDWWDQQGEHLPSYRIGRVGLPAEMFNLQWVGNLEDIKAILIKQGWEEDVEQNWITILHRLTDVQSSEHLPLLAPLYLDKKPVLELVKHLKDDKKLIVLRLWDANIIIKNPPQHLWVGSVGAVPRTYSWLFNYKNYNIDLDSALLFAENPSQYTIKESTKTHKGKRKRRLEQQQILFIKPI